MDLHFKIQYYIIYSNVIPQKNKTKHNLEPGGRSCAGERWPPPKSLDSDENFKPEHTLFFRELRFVAIYALFGDLWAKKCLFGSKTVFLGQEVHYYMVYFAYFTELILQICDYAQKWHIWRENCKYALEENFHCHFCSWRKAAKAPSSATLAWLDTFTYIMELR